MRISGVWTSCPDNWIYYNDRLVIYINKLLSWWITVIQSIVWQKMFLLVEHEGEIKDPIEDWHRQIGQTQVHLLIIIQFVYYL